MSVPSLPALAKILTYQHEGVIKRFCYENPTYEYAKIKQDFTDLLAWLWLSAKRKETGKKTYLFGPLIHLDELWHVFILHTRDYQAFCQQYFGEFVHHDVEPKGTEHEMDQDALEAFLSDAFDLLGESWVVRWFA